jgi:hypothetical protein
LIPFELEKIKDSYNFDFLGYDGNREIYKSELWDRLTFLLSMSGLILMPNIIKNIRNDRRSFSITTIDNTRIKIKYNQKIEFDKFSSSLLNVYDWFHVRSGTVHRHSFIEDKRSKFINKLFFYPSKRTGLNKNKKDVVAFSKIKESDLSNYDNSESYARLKVLKMMKDNGIRGTSNGYNKKGVQLHYAVKIEHSHRDIIKNYTPSYTMAEILQKIKKQGKLCNSTKKLFRHKLTSTSQGSYQLPDKI